MNAHPEKTVPYHSFFDLPRAAIIRDSLSVRLRNATKGMIVFIVKAIARYWNDFMV